MTDEPFDLTPFVKSFDLNLKNDLHPKITDDGNLYFWEYKPPSVDINLTFTNTTLFESMRQAIQGKQVMKMTQRGKYWFDPAFETDVIMTGVTMNADGSYYADYEGVNFVDLTDHRPLARFLRWILRR